MNFNPRSPCGERLVTEHREDMGKTFQSTLPVRGATRSSSPLMSFMVLFQSTLPVRGATWYVCLTCEEGQHFNPRSPCGERHYTMRFYRRIFKYFNPRSPCGERPSRVANAYNAYRFQSTLPVRGATGLGSWWGGPGTDFNPRSPCGERRSYYASGTRGKNFNPRSPCCLLYTSDAADEL